MENLKIRKSQKGLYLLNYESYFWKAHGLFIYIKLFFNLSLKNIYSNLACKI